MEQEGILVFFLCKLFLRFISQLIPIHAAYPLTPVEKFIELRRPVRAEMFHNASHI